MGNASFSVVNVPSSTMARASEIVLPTLAGPEVGVASTKAFTCQLATLACLAIAAGAIGACSRPTTRCRWCGRSPMFQAT
jgi:glucosamine 6-phosphate synthetase-like amidotransferase/phosphosugar isomerase protein